MSHRPDDAFRMPSGVSVESAGSLILLCGVVEMYSLMLENEEVSFFHQSHPRVSSAIDRVLAAVLGSGMPVGSDDGFLGRASQAAVGGAQQILMRGGVMTGIKG